MVCAAELAAGPLLSPVSTARSQVIIKRGAFYLPVPSVFFPGRGGFFFRTATFLPETRRIECRTMPVPGRDSIASELMGILPAERGERPVLELVKKFGHVGSGEAQH